MTDLVQALFAALSADAAFVASLDEYEGEPAIFSERLPEAYEVASAPCVIIGPTIGDENRDNFSATASRVEVWIRLYALHGGSDAAIEASAALARAALHRAAIDLGASSARAACSWPVTTPTSGPEITGRRISARLYVKG